VPPQFGEWPNTDRAGVVLPQPSRMQLSLNCTATMGDRPNIGRPALCWRMLCGHCFVQVVLPQLGERPDTGGTGAVPA